MARRGTDERVTAWRALARAHAVLVAELSAELEAEHGLALVPFEALTHLSEAPGQRLRMQELAERLPLTRSGLTRLADRLEDQGLIRRTSCRSDRRGTFAVLTATGRDVLERASTCHIRVLEERFACHLTSQELRTIRVACTKILRTPPAAGGQVEE